MAMATLPLEMTFGAIRSGNAMAVAATYSSAYAGSAQDIFNKLDQRFIRLKQGVAQVISRLSIRPIWTTWTPSGKPSKCSSQKYLPTFWALAWAGGPQKSKLRLSGAPGKN